ncbi:MULTISPECIES: calcium/sodium antiporter [Methanococcoides]|uniref:Calcium/sodium antiporter n=1 Tax=Methanococcoides seepicolus TaxID=2828780 RepID=A0A9E4ZE15_9EURY|nr:MULTISPECIES: calcium/sodium antiporter [Methanococcoides]MCM1985937.1 calcium/sodium antiporter [Methanococcoides seepicolus]MCM1986568.1 calcium/sodium antiporter [Methanococcoides seepicolus]NOQ48189.1 calcium/sodium antiporter [Methanococcoides sp.]
MLSTLLLFLLSLVLITKGADWFIEAAVAISAKSGLPKIIIGATIVSFATTAPEFTVSAMAAYLGHTDLTIGNAVGSAICNIGLALGVVIAVKAIPVDGHSFLHKGAIMLIAALTLIALTLDKTLSSFDGIILLTIFVGFLYYNYRLQSAIFDGNDKKREKLSLGEMRSDIFYFLLGATLVVIGSRILVDTGTEIARWFGIPEMIIGLTLVALGTSLPELITAISATLKGHQDLSIGNILGANTMDIALILGFSSQIRDIPILDQSLMYDFPFMIVIMLLLIIFGITKKRLDRWEGVVIMLVYFGYIAGLFLLYN